MKTWKKTRLSGEEAVALAAWHGKVELATGLRRTHSTTMLSAFCKLGGTVHTNTNERGSLEPALSAASRGRRAMTVLKHPELSTTSGARFEEGGALVIISAETATGNASQNGQIIRLEPADPQEAYDFMLAALAISGHWQVPVLLNVTPGVCREQMEVQPRAAKLNLEPGRKPWESARHLGEPMAIAQKLEEIRHWNESCELNRVIAGSKLLGIITSGACFVHAREAAPEASILKIGLTNPLPLKTVVKFAKGVVRCVVLEEGEPYLVQSIRAAGIHIEGKPEMYRFGKLDAARIGRILNYDLPPESPVMPGPIINPGMISPLGYTPKGWQPEQ